MKLMFKKQWWKIEQDTRNYTFYKKSKKKGEWEPQCYYSNLNSVIDKLFEMQVLEIGEVDSLKSLIDKVKLELLEKLK